MPITNISPCHKDWILPGSYISFTYSSYKAVFLKLLVFLSQFWIIFGDMGHCRPEVTNGSAWKEFWWPCKWFFKKVWHLHSRWFHVTIQISGFFGRLGDVVTWSSMSTIRGGLWWFSLQSRPIFWFCSLSLSPLNSLSLLGRHLSLRPEACFRPTDSCSKWMANCTVTSLLVLVSFRNLNSLTAEVFTCLKCLCTNSPVLGVARRHSIKA